MLQQEKQRKEEKQKQELERLKGVMKARDKAEKARIQDDSKQAVMRINLANSTTDIAYGYVKKDCVFKITTEEGVQYLFQALDKEDMLSWIKTISQVAERASTIRHRSMLLQDPNNPNAGSGSTPNSPFPHLEDDFSHQPLKKSESSMRLATFGLTLQEMFERDGDLVPLLVDHCITEVEKRGLNEEGIYRLSGSTATIQELKAAYDSAAENVDLSKPQWRDINVIIGTLKLFFRELKEPVIPFSAYNTFIDALAIEDYNDRLWRLKELIYELPSANYAVLKRLIGHLERVTDYEEINQMYATNLAIVFGPTLIRPPPEYSGMTAMVNMGKHNSLVKNLILQYHWVFDVEEDDDL